MVQELLFDFKAGLNALYGERLRGVYLFGSYARGEQDSESDVDIAIVLDAVTKYGAEIDRTSRLTSEVSLKYGVSISRVFLSERDWAAADSVFTVNARKEAVAA